LKSFGVVNLLFSVFLGITLLKNLFSENLRQFFVCGSLHRH